MNPPVEFDLHGLVGIRLLDAGPDETAAVSRQLGPIRSTLDREPDIVVRFVDRLPDTGDVRLLGVDDAGFTEDAFLVLRSRFKSRACVQIPFQDIGHRCEILCERGLIQVPLLIPILNLTALARGVLPLHASAFNYRGTGIVATGWSKGGKTETLLAFMAQGAEYVGDEWVYFRPDGTVVYGIPEPIRLWSWHLDQMPRYRGRVPGKQLVRLRALDMMLGLTNILPGNGNGGTGGKGVLTHRVRTLLRKQLHVDVTPERLFGTERCALKGAPDKIVWLASHDREETVLRPMDPEELARRMVFSLQEEQMGFLSYYWKFRFAFPEAANEFLDRSRQLQEELLRRTLENKECHELSHPYPGSIPSLFEALAPVCGAVQFSGSGD